MTVRRIKYVDVFTDSAFSGNPLAVVLDSEGLSTKEMQTIARWTNLSETTFVTSSDSADFSVRIFTRSMELPFAGHPSVGTTHAVVEAGLVDRQEHLSMECGAGIVSLTLDGNGLITVATPLTDVLDEEPDVAALTSAVGELTDQPMVIDAGPRWMVARMTDAESVRRLVPDMGLMQTAMVGTSAHGLTVYGLETDATLENAIEVRSLVVGDDWFEDPVCGSGNAAVGRHLRATGGIAETGSTYLARQGRPIGRDGFVRVVVSEEGVSIGGSAVTIVSGEFVSDSV